MPRHLTSSLIMPRHLTSSLIIPRHPIASFNKDTTGTTNQTLQYKHFHCPLTHCSMHNRDMYMACSCWFITSCLSHRLVMPYRTFFMIASSDEDADDWVVVLRWRLVSPIYLLVSIWQRHCVCMCLCIHECGCMYMHCISVCVSIQSCVCICMSVGACIYMYCISVCAYVWV